MKSFRSQFDVLMDILVVLYECKTINPDGLIRKAGLSNAYQREMVDILVGNNFININENKCLYLTLDGEVMVSSFVPGYKKAKSFYFEMYKEYKK